MVQIKKASADNSVRQKKLLKIDNLALDHDKEGSVVLVIGMHRSGTSLLSNVMQYLGCDMIDGTPHKNEWNVKGYWERQDFTLLQDAILTELGAPWGSANHAFPLQRNWWRMPTLKPLKLQMKEMLSRQFETRSGQWGYKDPRTTRLIPLWVEICTELGLRPKFIMAVRDPASVMASLVKRDGFSPAYAETLWLTYNFEALSSLGFDVATVSYEKWFEAPVEQARALISALELGAGQESDSQMQSVLDDIIAPDLRHFSRSQKRPLPVSRLASDTYAALEDPSGHDKLVGYAEEFHRAQRALSGWSTECQRLATALAHSEAQEQRFRAEELELKQRINRETDLIKQLRNEFSQSRQDAEAKHKTIVDVAAHRDQLMKQVANLEREIGELSNRLQSADANKTSVAELGAKLTASQESISTLVQERDKAAKETHRLGDELAMMARALEEEKGRKAALVGERDTLRSQSEALQLDLQSAKTKLVSLDDELKLAYDELHFYRIELRAAVDRATHAAEREGELNELVEQTSVEIERLQSEICDLSRDNAHLRTEITALKTASDNLVELQAQLLAQLDQEQTKAAALQAKAASFAELQSAWLDEREGLIERSEALDAELTRAQIEVCSLTDQASLLSRQIEQRDEALAGLNDHLEATHQEFRDLRTDYDILAQHRQSALRRADDAERSAAQQSAYRDRRDAAASEKRAGEFSPDAPAPHVGTAAHRLLRLWSLLAPDPTSSAPLFDSVFYLQTYPDVADAGIDPFDHYNLHGWQEGRDPNIVFSTSEYLSRNPDVQASGINPLLHYFLLGGREGRVTGGLFDNEFYVSANPDVVDTPLNPLQHFIQYGLLENRPYGEGLDLACFREEGDDLQEPMERFRRVITRMLAALAQIEAIELQVSNTPRLTIALRAGTNMPMLASSLQALAVSPPGVDFEVVVLDEGRMPGLSAVQSKWRGVRFHRLTREGNWATAMNAMVAVAAGPHVALLSPEMRPREGWAAEVLATFATRPDAMIVSGKVVDVTGELLHAGGLIWRDGSLSIRGAGQDPTHPAFSYARPIDQTAPSFTIVQRSAFLQLGGFDERYETADYATADLCLAVRLAGLKTWYQPLAVSLQFGQIHPSSCMNTDADRLRRQRPQSLAKLPDDTNIPGSDQRDRIGQILMVSQSVPTPDLDAGSVIHFEYLVLLGELGYQMHFVPEHSMADAGRYTRDLQRAGVQCIYRPYYQNLWEFARDKGREMDMVLLCRAPIAEHYLRIINPFCERAKVLIDCMDLHHIREEREAAVQGSKEKHLAAAETRRLELDAIANADMTVVVSEFERDYLAEKVPDANVAIIPLVLDCFGRQAEFEELSDICYVGGYRHKPNVDAVIYFVSEIWPLIRERLPGVRFRVMGSFVPGEIAALASDDVVIDGFVPDLATSLGRCRLSVAPLRFGAGIKGKIGSSLSYGVPCVASPIASEGMGLGSYDGVLCADGVETFADAVIQLYTDRTQWYRMSNGGLEFVRANYSHEATRARLRSILKRLNLPGA